VASAKSALETIRQPASKRIGHSVEEERDAEGKASQRTWQADDLLIIDAQEDGEALILYPLGDITHPIRRHHPNRQPSLPFLFRPAAFTASSALSADVCHRLKLHFYSPIPPDDPPSEAHLAEDRNAPPAAGLKQSATIRLRSWGYLLALDRSIFQRQTVIHAVRRASRHIRHQPDLNLGSGADQGIPGRVSKDPVVQGICGWNYAKQGSVHCKERRLPGGAFY